MVLHCRLSSEGQQRRINTKKGPLIDQKTIKEKKYRGVQENVTVEDGDSWWSLKKVNHQLYSENSVKNHWVYANRGRGLWRRVEA
jgi:hypothetical protein